MKLALLSDIHANIQALDACLAHARRLGAHRYALLGDLVGYGADPGAVVRRAMALLAQGALLVKGNHDEMAVNPPQEARTIGDSTAAWTHSQLDADERSFLDALPLTLQHESILLVHASAEAPELWRYVYERRAAALSLDAATALAGVHYVFGGHVHQQTLYHRGRWRGIDTVHPATRRCGCGGTPSSLAGHHRLGRPAPRRQAAGHVRNAGYRKR